MFCKSYQIQNNKYKRSIKPILGDRIQCVDRGDKNSCCFCFHGGSSLGEEESTSGEASTLTAGRRAFAEQWDERKQEIVEK